MQGLRKREVLLNEDSPDNQAFCELIPKRYPESGMRAETTNSILRAVHGLVEQSFHPKSADPQLRQKRSPVWTERPHWEQK